MYGNVTPAHHRERRESEMRHDVGHDLGLARVGRQVPHPAALGDNSLTRLHPVGAEVDAAQKCWTDRIVSAHRIRRWRRYRAGASPAAHKESATKGVRRAGWRIFWVSRGCRPSRPRLLRCRRVIQNASGSFHNRVA